MIAALFIRLVGGDAEKALEELHHRYYRPLLRFVDATINCREVGGLLISTQSFFLTLTRYGLEKVSITITCRRLTGW
ncbi:hypothetical protein CLV51_104276 [Chitinophaga niastensis]|uniref:Uncharacterized protein n=1 Tax=Chitinophaga niastensis TaxID=536980 RepID=A0A2P8HH97_CHINA|nr:hypothetical protein [Chitinophaga niastensis]PSL45570.1 hypothetical protein CLV51_104276 [Chitinophaga niastensis]